MTRLTRNSYKRKIILFGIFIFVSIALISTGFAAWVMSSDDTEQDSGNVEVGTVADSSVNIEILNSDSLKDFEYRFEPNTASADDLIHAGEENGETKLESLELVIKGKVTGLLLDVNIKMVLPAGVQNAISGGYITNPIITFYKNESDCANHSNGTLLNKFSAVPKYTDTYTFKDLVSENNGEFVITVSFAWGSVFGGQNPCDTYNKDYADAKADYIEAKTKWETTGLAEDHADMNAKLEAMNDIKADAQAALANLKLLRAHIYGYYDLITEDTTVDKLAADPQYKSPIYVITITALAN